MGLPRSWGIIAFIRRKSRLLSNGRDLQCMLRQRHSTTEAALHISSQTGLADEVLDIRASGLRPGQRVVLHTIVDSDCKRFKFESDALYEADSGGNVSVSTHPSIQGTYTGVDAMGPLWSMGPDQTSAAKKARMIKSDFSKPWVYRFTLSDEQERGQNLHGKRNALSTCVVERRIVAQDVEIIEVNCGSAQGSLYLPPMERGSQSASHSLLLIVDMPGLGPGPPRDKAALLASHGFAVFALDYFAPLKDKLQTGGTAYFDARILYDVVDYAKGHPHLDADRIGIYGSCYGGTLALHSVCRLPDLPIRCMILQRGIDVLTLNVGLKMSDGTIIHPAPHPESYADIKQAEDGKQWFHFDFHHHIFNMATNESFVAPAAKRIEDCGKRHLLDFNYLHGAGHLLDTPYLPLCKESRMYVPKTTGAVFVKWGGDPVMHAAAQVKAWRKTINFFRKQLGPVNMCRKDWLDDEP